tara:strand:+ start:289 stop:1224 length:936 start_codon:yes stop_codon:yes gene_type:complete
MASTYTNRLGLEKQTDGENPNSWGAILNTNVIDLLDEAIAGYTIVSVSGVPLTLTDNAGSTDQSRNAALEFAGTLTANVTITIPSEQKTYFVRENTSGSFGVQMKTVAGTALELTQGDNIFVACDGASIYPVDIPTSVSTFTANTLNATTITTSILNATDVVTSIIGTSIMNATYINTSSVSTTVLNVDGAATFSGPVVGTVVTLADAASVAVNLAQSNNFYVQMTSAVGSSRVLENPTNAVIGQCGAIYIIQAVSGAASKTMSFGDAYRFKSGTAPTITQSTSAVDLLVYNVRDVSIIDVLPAQNLKVEA